MFHLRLLGPPSLTRDDGSPLQSVLAQPKRFALLAYLAAAEPSGPQPRERLLALFWPESDEERARNSLKQSLFVLRRSLGDATLQPAGLSAVELDPAVVACDVAMLRAALRRQDWEEAVTLFRGDFLEGLGDVGAPPFERWAEEMRARLRSAVAEAAGRLSAQAEAAGELNRAAEWARRSLELAPGDEATVRRLMSLLDRLGDRAGAVEVYEQHERRLREEYDAEPAPETRSLIQLIREREAPRWTPEIPAPLPLPPAGQGSGPGPLAGAPPRGRRARAGVAVMALAALSVALAGRWQGEATADSEARDLGKRQPSVAVLPFVNVSADPANEYFSDGITEEILNGLARLDGLRVPARTSSFQFKGDAVDVREVARRLEVEAVLEGSVRRSGDRVRITAQLSDARDGYQLWAGTYDRRITDIFAVQADIARSIVDALRGTLSREERDRLARRPTEDPEAHVLFLKGRYVLQKRTAAALNEAIRYFRAAIERDPSHAPAYAGMADAYLLLGGTGLAPMEEMLPPARAAAEQALQLDPGLADGHVSRAAVLMQERRWEEADAAFRNVIQSSPNHPTAHHWYSILLEGLGRTDAALDEARLALRADPLSPAINNNLGRALYLAGRHEEAVAQLEATLRMEPMHRTAVNNLAKAYLQVGRIEEAEALLRQVLALGSNPNALAILAELHIRAGRPEAARAVLDTLAASAARSPAVPLRVAMVYAQLGDADAAFAWLDRVRWYADGVASLRAEPGLRPLRSDPRYERILQDLGLR